MPRVSKRLVEKKKMDRFLNDFWNVVASLETKKEAEGFFYDLLTHTERQMLAKRLQVAVMLIQGHEYRAINEEVKVANATITKVNNWLKTGAYNLAKAAQILIGFKEGKNSRSIEGGGGSYLAGDLLMPAVEAGMKAVAKKLKKRKRR